MMRNFGMNRLPTHARTSRNVAVVRIRSDTVGFPTIATKVGTASADTIATVYMQIAIARRSVIQDVTRRTTRLPMCLLSLNSSSGTCRTAPFSDQSTYSRNGNGYVAGAIGEHGSPCDHGGHDEANGVQTSRVVIALVDVREERKRQRCRWALLRSLEHFPGG
ncbi:hypothetical protein PBRA_003001 [Plasmodiophora brassicae]|uniref:Uncharacterized protein n=1 Tax=Plasmodiophora brassicae TaxID=37360 RepID=A0A0G4J7L5_PLABS|nr:hypothetical protein PBRA_003001 [Plasmodiophora brassicae]